MRLVRLSQRLAISFAVSALILGTSILWHPAQGQDSGTGQTPAPQPTPNPTPAPQPSNDPYNPPTFDFSHPKPPPTFKSPLGTPKPGPGEATAFDALISLYDATRAAGDAWEEAKKCGTKEEADAAEEVLAKADRAFYGAVTEYVRDYSANVYPTSMNFDASGKRRHSEAQLKFNDEWDAVLNAVLRASKYKGPPLVDCPIKPHEPDGPKPPLKSKHHHAITEDDPRYMENYQPPANLSPPPHHNNSSRSDSPPTDLPPNEDDGPKPNNPYDKPPDLPIETPPHMP